MKTYTDGLYHTKRAAKVSGNIKRMNKRQLAEIKPLAGLIAAECFGANHMLSTLIDNLADGHDLTTVLEQAKAAIEQHQHQAAAFAEAMREQEVFLAKLAAQAAIQITKGAGHEH